MSNPWETDYWEKQNPWGKGSENWNRWMDPPAKANPTKRPSQDDVVDGLVEIRLQLGLKIFSKWSGASGLKSFMEVPQGAFIQADLDAINQELREIFTPGIVQVPKELVRKLQRTVSAIDTYKLDLSFVLSFGGDLMQFDEAKRDFAIVVSGAKKAAYQVDAWADPESESDALDSDKTRAPLAFRGKEPRQNVNTITLNPFIYNVEHPGITRQGPDGYLVKCVNRWQAEYYDGVPIGDASDASVIAHELSHFIYRESELGVPGNHGNGGINEFEKDKIRFNSENRQLFILRYLKELLS